MNIAVRSYLTAGVAVLGAGAIALSPVQPIPSHLAATQQRAIATLSVNLAATVNPFQAWSDAFSNTVNNGLTLAQYFLENPFPLATTWAANQVTYLQELFSGNADKIFPQIQNNLKTLFEAPLDPGPTVTLPNEFAGTSVTWPSAVPGNPGNFSDGCSGTPGGECGQAPTGVNLLALQLLAGASQVPVDPEDFPNWDTFISISPFYRFAASFGSGVAVGALGTVLSPLVSLSNSFTSFGANLQAGKVLDALYDIINIPANMTNAFFNGAGFLDLTPVLEAFGIDLNAGEIKFGKVGLNLGGLLNLTPVDDPVTKYNGGIAIDALGGPETGEGFLGDQKFWGVRVGLGGSMVGMGQFLGEKLRVTPPAPTAAVAPAAAVADAPAPAVKAPAPAVADASAVKAPAPAVADIPAPAMEAPAPAVADAPAAAVAAEVEAAVAAEAEAATSRAISEPAGRRGPAASAGGDAAGDADRSATRGRNARG